MSKTKFKETEIGMIPEDWSVVKINEIAAFVSRGISPSYTEEELVQVINQRCTRNGQLTLENARFTDPNKKKIAQDKYIQKQDILINSTGVGTLGRVSQIKLVERPTTVDSHVTIVRIKEDKASPEYVCYYLRLKQQFIENMAEGSTGQIELPRETVKKIPIAMPLISEQQSVVQILSDFDSQIEVLQAQNKTLEEMGKLLFKHWFVDFEFPNGKGNPYRSSGGVLVESELGEIPEGWDVGFLGDNKLTTLIKPNIDEFKGEKIYLATADVKSNQIVNENTRITFHKKPSRANMQPKINTVWFAKMKDSKKSLLINKYSEDLIKNKIFSTGFSGLEIKHHALYYIWCIINNSRFEVIKNNLCNGTTMEAINNETIKKIKIIVPSVKVLETFDKIIKPVFSKITINNNKISHINKTRDLLLPKLMTGKIRVPMEVEI